MQNVFPVTARPTWNGPPTLPWRSRGHVILTVRSTRDRRRWSVFGPAGVWGHLGGRQQVHPNITACFDRWQQIHFQHSKFSRLLYFSWQSLLPHCPSAPYSHEKRDRTPSGQVSVFDLFPWSQILLEICWAHQRILTDDIQAEIETRCPAFNISDSARSRASLPLHPSAFSSWSLKSRCLLTEVKRAAEVFLGTSRL